MINRKALLVALGLIAAAAGSYQAAAAPALTTERIASGAGATIYLTHAPNDYDRLFVVDQVGRIRIIKNGALLATPFLDIDAKTNGSGEEGLLGLAFHPGYSSNGQFYVYYTDLSGRIVVGLYTVSANPDVANTAEQIVIRIDHPFSNHNGGWLAFGPDGYLYMATGDGGSGNDPNENAQNLSSLLGKMLRLDVNGDDFPTDTVKNYAIPADNPFVGIAGADEIWAYGLRNPWRDSFDRLTGDIYIADVGQDEWEELNFQPASSNGGENYGWDCMEGNECRSSDVGCTCPNASLTLPFHTYVFNNSPCDSITGGYVYRGCAIDGLQGTYFFADYCREQIWSLRYDGSTVTEFQERTAELDPPTFAINSPASFGEDAYGELYIADRGGEIFKIKSTQPVVDCNANVVADLCDISRGTSQDQNNNQVPDECEPPTDLPAALTPNSLGTCTSGGYRECDVDAMDCPSGSGTCERCGQVRYISFNIPANSEGDQTAIRIRLDSLHHPSSPPAGTLPSFAVLEGQDRYLNALPGAFSRCCDPNSNPTKCHNFVNCASDADCVGLGVNSKCYKNMCPDSTAYAIFFRCASVGCNPEYRDWSDFAGIPTYATNDAIISSSSYSVSHLGASCAGNESSCLAASAPLVVGTERWGNVDCSNGNNGSPNATDVARVVDEILDGPSGVFLRPRVHIRAALLNPLNNVNASDAGHAVNSTKGFQYPFHIKCTTTTACTTNAQCTAPATCSANGFCTNVKDSCSGLCQP